MQNVTHTHIQASSPRLLSFNMQYLLSLRACTLSLSLYALDCHDQRKAMTSAIFHLIPAVISFRLLSPLSSISTLQTHSDSLTSHRHAELGFSHTILLPGGGRQV